MLANAHCLRCGSADTRPDKGRQTWTCFRCDKSFTPAACPRCGSFRVSGSQGVSGVAFVKLPVVIRCDDCREEFAPLPQV
jgi:hypothetical protein